MSKKPLQIAIDGPVGSGKGTIALALAKKLNMTHIYTGAMYRALTLACLKENIDVNSEEKVFELLKKISIELKPTKFDTRVLLNNEDVSDEIFLPKVANKVSIVSVHPSVRKEMVSLQKKIINKKNAIIEGRDIATSVAPHADLKIYLTADVKTRAQRRLTQLKDRGVITTFEKVLEDTQKRDKIDSGREVSPLTITPDSFVLDNTNLTIEETVDQILEKLKEKSLI